MTEVVEATLPIAPVSPTSENQPFWDALADGRFVLPRCRQCGVVIWYPRGFCADCARTDTIEWFEPSGRGTVYSFTIIRKSRGPWADQTPFVAAYVELEEGPRIMTNIVGCQLDEVRIGQAVEVVIEADGAGGRLHRFRPVRA